ncbi:hypothetical protein PT520_11905 [Aliarcobacter butzleri]|uniref:DUF2972 domain-containing protein n=1 Tax=Aliarcobacter butzleri TaxID=28197 RepID=A0AAW6VS45_9BACT|nr:hypothetical protein [Aliarcobacter butzleri]MDK2063221.1 hypothetical protein [Aliarcobacter butzleri]MDK2071153.1 hypothetical protein [Aliarcobacter butzleri]
MVNYNRLFHILNRNISKEYKYCEQDVKNCFAKTSYDDLTDHEKVLISKTFKEVEDAEDIDFIIKDLDLNKENIKSIYISSPYNNKIKAWNNYFNIPYKKEANPPYKPMDIDKILSPTLKKLAIEKLNQGYKF